MKLQSLIILSLALLLGSLREQCGEQAGNASVPQWGYIFAPIWVVRHHNRLLRPLVAVSQCASTLNQPQPRVVAVVVMSPALLAQIVFDPDAQNA
ncbi:hypothetical protein GBA52_025340 [Prunus armeniaca]|nr:hypothetical protein GBA52_025340 [Prunus armeniaca]